MNLLTSEMRSWNIFLCLLIIFPASLFAQQNISGTISENGNPISGAIVRLDSTYSLDVTDAEGKFSLQVEDDREHSLTISHMAFQTVKKSVRAGNILQIELTPQTYLVEEVSVAATRVDHRSVFAYTQVEKLEIEKQNLGQDIPFLLNTTPSVVVTSDGGNGIGYTGIRIRGSDATRINVTINGIPVNDAESHQVYWVDLPDLASSVENIQIQRGLGSAANGAGAFGGSLNILTNKRSADPYATISSSAGSFNTFKNSVMFGSGLINDVFAIEGRLSKINSDGYIDRATSDLKSFYLNAGYYGKKNSLRAVIISGKEKTYQAWYGVPEDSLETNRTYNPAGEYYDANGNVHYYDNQTDNFQQDYYQLLYSHEFSRKLNANLALHYTRGEGYYEEYRQKDDLSSYNFPSIMIGDSTITNADLVRQLWLSNHFYGFTWSLNYNTDVLDLTLGGAANRFDNDHYGELIASEIMLMQPFPFRNYRNEAEKTDVNVYARGVYSPSKSAHAFAELQQRMINYSFEGFDDEYLMNRQDESMSFFNPKAGITIMPSSDMTTYFSVGIGHKEPVRDDFVYSTPSRRPEAEHMIDYETGMRFASGKTSLEVNGYYMDYKNQLILTGKINDVGEYIRESVKNSYRSGVEIAGAYNLSSNINLKANFTFSKNRIKKYVEYVDDYDGGPQLLFEYRNSAISFSPEIIGAFVFSVAPVKNLTIDLTGKYVGRQYLDNTMNQNRKLDPYFVNDLHLSYAFHPKKMKEIVLKLSVYNLFDREYISNGYSYSGFIGGERNDYNYYFPQAKLNVLGGVIIKL